MCDCAPTKRPTSDKLTVLITQGRLLTRGLWIYYQDDNYRCSYHHAIAGNLVDMNHGVGIMMQGTRIIMRREAV